MLRIPVEPSLPDMEAELRSSVSTTNACKLCTPLGACLAFRGIEGAIPFLHGSQGCATYIRRYIISHFKEPMDIASSSFSETTAIYGGEQNLHTGLKNVTAQYHPSLIGVASTCLSETIGDDVKGYIGEYLKAAGSNDSDPVLIPISTPSYKGTHMDGFHSAIHGVVDVLTEGGPRRQDQINLLPGLVSPADLRYLREIVGDFGLSAIMLPDYSETLDGPVLDAYEKIPSGGTPVADIRRMGQSAATIEFGRTLAEERSASHLLKERCGVASYRLNPPIGICQTDAFFELLETLSGKSTPECHKKERGRLVDAYIDAHKYVFGKRAVVYGEEDFVTGIAALLAEIGVIPVICGSGGESSRMAENIRQVAPEYFPDIAVREGVDFMTIADEAEALKPDLIIGNSKGLSLARRLGIPLVRVGFPIHDRIGGQRLLHLGYRGAQQLFDGITNALIAQKQATSPVGYSYM